MWDVTKSLDFSTSYIHNPMFKSSFTNSNRHGFFIDGTNYKYVYRNNVYINKETIIIKKDNKRLGIGPVVYGGFNMGSRQLDWGVGIGITYHILEW